MVNSLDARASGEGAPVGGAFAGHPQELRHGRTVGTLDDVRAVAVEQSDGFIAGIDGGDDAVYHAMIAKTLGIDMAAKAAATPWLAATVEWAWRTKLMISGRVDAR